MTTEKKDIYWRAYLVYFGFVVLMLVVVIKTFSIQFEGKSTVFATNTGAEERMPTKSEKRIPRRGEILDANYTPLVTSVSFYDIHMDPTVVDQELFDKNINELSIRLAELFPTKTAVEYEQYIRTGRKRGRRYLLIKRRATNEERKKLRTFPIFEKGRLKGGISVE